MRCLLIVPLLAALALPAPANAANAAIEQAIDGFVRPAYDRLHVSTATLSETMRSLCAEPSPAHLSTSREKFAEAVEAWSEVEIIRFGPITEGNRLERMMFWPDRKSIGLKQVQAALASEDATAADAGQLAGKSIAMQGFGALDYILFGAGAGDLDKPAGAYRCRYGAAISVNLDTMASGVASAWRDPDGFARTWANPAPDNPGYHGDDEALTELLDTLLQGLEMLRDVRINGFLGRQADGDKPNLAIFRRSGATVASLEGNLRGLKSILVASGLGKSMPEESRWVVDSIEAQFTNGISTLSAVDGPIDALLSDPAKRNRLSFARDVTSSLSVTIGNRLAGDLGLTAGFSSLDGD